MVNTVLMFDFVLMTWFVVISLHVLGQFSRESSVKLHSSPNDVAHGFCICSGIVCADHNCQMQITAHQV